MNFAQKLVIPGSLALSIALLAAPGCTVNDDGPGRPGTGGDGGGVGPGTDGGQLTYPDGGGPVNACSPGCGPEEICGATNDGNGLDDDCDTRVDEGCTCMPGETRPCFAGPPDRRNIGACADGIEACTEFGIWGACVGGVSPSAETCNGSDDDCNGTSDDLAGCSSAVMCPGNDVAPPLSNFTLRGDRVYTGEARSWTWSLDCPDSVPAELCPTLATPTAENTDVYLTASGAYRVNVTVTLADGTTASCAWTLYVRGGGLRVELNWDTMLDTAGGTDVDLHLHRWTRNGVDTDFFNDDDCYYLNCQPDDDLTWAGHADSALENCDDAPHGGGATWRDRGSCRNPRLDVDTNGTDGACRASVTDPNSDAFCAPENINVDSPVIGMPYRVMVNYFSDSGHSEQTMPTVNIYCGGALRGSFGSDPFVFLRNGDSLGEANDNWYVADVVFFMGECGLDCMVYPLGQVMQGTEDDIGFSVAPFGPMWSCDYNAANSTCTAR
ncbi:hypothetical protein [Sandaracinus amylolyticus]|uniref:hypothetical protein n=1 Tax=Sandaracinus amylolyticus TaxID=927083 RepID=UPI001F34A507|nr:hypothetical protein [Sandaracinus amylolyticus]UJR83875.1 Hypothetical protein I5071_59460 [Sandaracinus amylolyticus]